VRSAERAQRCAESAPRWRARWQELPRRKRWQRVASARAGGATDGDEGFAYGRQRLAQQAHARTHARTLLRECCTLAGAVRGWEPGRRGALAARRRAQQPAATLPAAALRMCLLHQLAGHTLYRRCAPHAHKPGVAAQRVRVAVM
jgi:hypothetical protein